MDFAFRHWQTLHVRAYATSKHRVAVDMYVVRRNRCGNIAATCQHEFDRLLGSDMFKHHAQRGEARQHGCCNALNKLRFPIKYIDLRIGDFTMHQHADFCSLANT